MENRAQKETQVLILQNLHVEVAMELEDDLFFADLSRQISLLIMDDDDDENPVANYPSVSFQDFSSVQYPIAAPSPNMLEQAYRRESKGTGVFIPRSSQPRRKHKQSSRYNSSSNNNNSTSTTTTRSHQYRKNNGSSTRVASEASYSDSFNRKKC